jgi:malate dehydrogenase (quinone)
VVGSRPQLIDKDHRKLTMGEAEIDTGVGVSSICRRSARATCCLENAEIDRRNVADCLGATVDEEALAAELLVNDQRHKMKDLPL